MNLSATHPLMLFLIGVIFVKRASLTFVTKVNSGTTVSFLCSNILKEPSYIAWFKQTNDSLPLCIVTQYVTEKPADSKYFNGFKENRVEMSVNKTFSSLKIVNVDISDSGIFYCGSFLQNHMMFHNKTQLVVVNETNQSTVGTANADCVSTGATEETLRSCNIYYTLTLILSGLVLIPTVLVIVVLIRLKERNKQKEDAQRCENNEEINKQLQHQEQDADLNYAALNLDKKKSRRPVRRLKEVEPNVVYAATR
ncbi:LOW QUALITY PROTEIN: novel immune-type receptor 7b [Labeo rohita]|uniref:LOW QUALITY PROTEIN: novel immune-type receptor 7b n=1 Tax=Labeo rohita TaxID=84645 RepID=UPI0021E25FA9|nr:LOW QUALITY PROTEIN: novel immune-type receptor 7b [Labeo rohita]